MGPSESTLQYLIKELADERHKKDDLEYLRVEDPDKADEFEE